ncbi:MAG: aldehyde ferredoxin oxidoreductase C-terminal domain-containing protein [Dethiobacteria bacterium]
MEYGTAGLKAGGTGSFLGIQNETSSLPTKNWKTGYLEGGRNISGDTVQKEIFAGHEGCFACPVVCKKAVKAEKPYEIDLRYGDPEYESLAY